MDGRPVRCDPTDRRRAAAVDRRTLGALCRLIDSLRSLSSAANQLGGGDREAKPTDASTRSAVHQGEPKPVKVYRSGIVRGNSKSAQTSYGRVRINPKGRTDRRRKGGKG